jgi:hypothetical protein
VQTFDEWFKNFNSWGASRDDLIRFSYTPGDSPGDTVFTSPLGHEMTRHQAFKWFEFYSAAQAGWDAHAKQSHK